jgi:arginine-tRNA-protein transferase
MKFEPNNPEQARHVVDEFLARVSLPVSEPGPCPYLPGHRAASCGFSLEEEMAPAVYAAFMARGFRRSGRVFYRPQCPVCRLCIPLRVPVATFRPTRSQRRVWRSNADLHAEVGAPVAAEEKHDLFTRYLAAQHDGTMATDRDSFERFLYDPTVPALEVCYFVGRRLVGVSLLDDAADGYSSVYMFFDPQEARRSLGTYSVLWEIEFCRAAGRAYYYVGYWVPGSPTMAYKARFKPAEILDRHGRWVPLEAAGIS